MQLIQPQIIDILFVLNKGYIHGHNHTYRMMYNEHEITEDLKQQIKQVKKDKS